MAALQERNGSYRVLFRYHTKQYSYPVGEVSADVAEIALNQVKTVVGRLKAGFLHLSPGTDLLTFIRHEGKPPEVYRAPDSVVRTTLGTLRDRYISTHSNGTIEANSLDTIRLHFSHFCRFLGEGFPLTELSALKLQQHIVRRARKGISPVTIRQEIATLRAAWNWGRSMELTSGSFPDAKRLRYPKGQEKPPFQTRTQIERAIAGGGNAEELWECLFLTLPEIRELPDFVRGAARQPWVYPLFSFAAHTGARRSEMLRALVTDVDLDGNAVIVREKKRVKSQRTTRRLTITPAIKKDIEEWLAVHTGGPLLFCLVSEV